jgi:S1-C subfamily serine protease
MKYSLHIVAAIVASTFLLAYVSPALAASPDDQNAAQTVIVTSAERTKLHLGAGVVVSRSGSSLVVITAAHVVEDGGLTVTTSNGQVLNVTNIARLPGFDLAILTTSSYFGPVREAKVGTPALGALVHVWGHRAAHPYIESAGSISDLDPLLPEGPANGRFAIDCARCDHGDSGAGVFDASGRLVGILEGARMDQEGKIAFVQCEPITPALAAIGMQPTSLAQR